MIGWLFMVGFAVILFAGLWLVGGMRRPAFEFVAAALILAFAGYQWQGRPGLAGAPEEGEQGREEVTASLIDMRVLMDRNFSSAKNYLLPSDGYARQGDFKGAVQILRGGVRNNPGDADLWTAIGLDLMMDADGTLPPAAKLAFERARAADPRHPGPIYFTGLAALRSGQPEEALILWTGLLQGDFRAGDWRAKVQTQADALSSMLNGTMQADGPMPQGQRPSQSGSAAAARP